MKNSIATLRDFAAQHSIVRFASVGVVSTILDLTFYVGSLALGLPIELAATLGFLAGLTNGYLLNSKHVFQTNRHATNYGKYFAVSFGGLLITLAIIQIVHVHLRLMGAFEAKLLAVAIVFFWNYGLSKAWAFK